MEGNMKNRKEKQEPRTYRVEECAEMLGIGRSAAYSLVREAASAGGKPFCVVRIGKRFLVSKKSFEQYLEASGL